MHDPHNAERASQRGSSDDVVFIPRAAVVPGEYLVTGGCSGWHGGGGERGLNGTGCVLFSRSPLPPLAALPPAPRSGGVQPGGRLPAHS